MPSTASSDRSRGGAATRDGHGRSPETRGFGRTTDPATPPPAA